MRFVSDIRRIGVIVASLGAVWLAVGCNPVKVPPPPAKRPPETELTFAPVQFDTTTFRVHFYWNAYDDDGEVVQFRFAVDADTALPVAEWRTTTAKDTTLLFLVDPVAELKLHVFRIAAEDNDSLIDPTPASRTFSAKTVPPTSKIERGPSAFNPVVGPNFTYEWSGIDPDGGETGGKVAVDSFQYLLLLVGATADVSPTPQHDPLPRFDQTTYVSMIRDAVGDGLLDYGRPRRFDDWKWKGIRGLKNRFRNATPGEYVFALRAVDVAGATEKDLVWITNMRHFTVTNRNPGPTLTVRSSILNSPLLPLAFGPEDVPRKQLQIFEGETVSFAWSASAETYGGQVVGYMHALDDTSKFSGLDPLNLGKTFQPSVLTPGPHFLYVRAVDDGGLVTNMVIPILVVHPAFKDPGAQHAILFVDDSTSPGNSLLRSDSYPSDDEETDWWTLGRNGAGPLFSLGVPYTEWDTTRLGFLTGEGRKQPEPKDLATFTTVVWTTDFTNAPSNALFMTALYKSVAGGNYSELQAYLRAGGTLILTGWNLAQNTSTRGDETYKRTTPGGMCNTFRSGSNEFNGTIFPRMFMGIDNTVPNEAGRRALGAADFVRGVPTPPALTFGFDTARVDTGSATSGAKWNTNPRPAGNPDENLAPGLPKIEGWYMATFFGCQDLGVFGYEDHSQPIVQPMYTYHGVRTGWRQDGDPSPREGLVCGILAQSHDLGTSDPGTGSATYDPKAAVGRLAIFTFPFYFLKDADALNMMVQSFAYVNASPTLP